MEFILQLIFVLILVLLNGFFVASEFALVGVRKTRIQELANKDNAAAKMVLKALNDLETYISSTQLGITLASLALGWIGEPALAHFFEPFLSFLPHQVAVISAHSIAVIIAFTVITVLHIVLGELAPKSIALQTSEKTALAIIRPLFFFTKVFSPAIWLLNHAGIYVVKLLGLSGHVGHQLLHSEEEIRMILEQSGAGGIIKRGEVEMVQNVFQLGDIPIKQIMIPRTEVIAFPKTIMLDDVVKRIQKYAHSRYPIYDGSIDTIIGFVHVKDIYSIALTEDGKKKLADLDCIRETITVPETKKADDVLRDMRRNQVHLVVINDEYGGTAGVVSLEDILESLVGEIEDEFDRPARDIIKQADGTFLVDGLTTVDRIQRRFALPLRGQGYTTIGGLVFGLLGREPQVGDKLQIGGITFEVHTMSRKRITTLLLIPSKREKKNRK